MTRTYYKDDSKDDIVTPKDLFKEIGAQHQMCSWGAVTARGEVVLCAWRHHAQPLKSNLNKWRIRVASMNTHSEKSGVKECARYLKKVAKGTPGYLLLCCQTGDEAAYKSTLFDKHYLYTIESVIQLGDLWYATIDLSHDGRVAVNEFRQQLPFG